VSRDLKRNGESIFAMFSKAKKDEQREKVIEE